MYCSVIFCFIIIYFVWEIMLRKIVVGLLSITPFILVTGCNSGSVQSASNDVAVNTATAMSNSVTSLAATDISPSSSEDSCLKAVLEQTQNSNKLTTTVTFNNTCNYDTYIGGYRINFTSEYTDDSKAQLDPISFAYLNSSGNTRSYTLKLVANRYACPNSSGSFENLTGVLGARKVQAGTSVVLKGITTLASGKVYDLPLAKASFRVLSPTSVAQNELGTSLSDPESFNYALSESNTNKGNDSLRNIPLNQYGLKTIMITNHRCTDVESAIPTLVLPSKVTIDRLRTTCKIDGSQRLLSEQSCRFVLRYDPQANDIMQAYESLVNVDVYARAVNNGLILRSNVFKIPYSSRGKISGVQIVNDKLVVVDNQPNGLKNTSIGSFGLKTYTISNSSGQAVESITLSYAPTSLGLPAGLAYDSTRTTCKLDGTQALSAGQSCNVAIKYTPKMQQVEESAVFQAVGYLSSSNKSVAYVSNKSVLAYSTSVNNTASIMPTSTDFISGFDIDANVTGLTFNNSITSIPAGSFGLKAYLISNDTGQNMYNVNINNIAELSALATLKIDETRSTCKFNTTLAYNKFSLKEGKSCLLVFKYSPTTTNTANVNYNLIISGYDAAGSKVVSEATIVQATSR